MYGSLNDTVEPLLKDTPRVRTTLLLYFKDTVGGPINFTVHTHTYKILIPVR